MEAASWQDRVDALGRGHYRRYDERTATMLGTGARLCLDRWHGDLRRLHKEAGADRTVLRRLLTEFPGIGPTGADIFLREAQSVWPDVRPYADRRTLAGARRLGRDFHGLDLRAPDHQCREVPVRINLQRAGVRAEAVRENNLDNAVRIAHDVPVRNQQAELVAYVHQRAAAVRCDAALGDDDPRDGGVWRDCGRVRFIKRTRPVCKRPPRSAG